MGRRTWLVLVLAIMVLATLVVALLVLWKSSRTEIITCTNYNSQVWAQSLFESDLSRYAALDPDGDGLACEGCHTASPRLSGQTRFRVERSRHRRSASPMATRSASTSVAR